MSAEALETLPAKSLSINLDDYRKAMLNILDDFGAEKKRLEDTHRASLNILEDFTEEKIRLEEMQRAMLNLLDDFQMEREKTEAVNRELRDAEEEVKKSLGEKESLLKEIHHRVKNNLQIIHSMLNLQLPYLKDEQAIQLFKESRDRVYSMALIHEQLFQSESLARIDLGEYIPSLVDNLFLSYGVDKRTIIPRINVEKITLAVDTVIPSALIINELISNSLKHAFPDSLLCADRKGEIRIDLYNITFNKFKLTVCDNGVGLPEGFEIQNCKSLGLKLVTVLVKQLKGTLHLNTSGKTEFVITFEALN